MVYDNSLDNQHKTTRKFARRWFGPYVVKSANDNATYHIVELDGSRLAIPLAGKRVKISKKRQDKGPNLEDLNGEDGTKELADMSEVNEDMEGA